MKKTTIPVFFAIDDNYSPFLCVALRSLVKHSSINNQYNIYILNTGLSEKNINVINSFSADNIKITSVNMEEKIKNFSNRLHTRDYYSKTTYYRLFIPTMFPQYNKALYLDSDIVILSDVANLFNTNIGKNLVGAIPDESVQIVPEFYKYVENFLGVERINYFNAGILVMNLDEMRKQNFEEKFLNLLMTVKFNVAQDQDYLNVICKDKVKYISFSWNKMPFKCNNVNIQDLNIIHYNLSFKPWHYDDILYQEEFWENAKEIGLEEQLLNIRNNYTPEQKQKDLQCGENLKEMALAQSKLGSTFHKFSLNVKVSV